MGLRSLVRALSRHWILAAAVFLVSVTAGLVFSPGPPLTFTASARVAWPEGAPLLGPAVLERAIRSELGPELPSASGEELARSVERLQAASRARLERGVAVLSCRSGRPSFAIRMANAVARSLESEADEIGRRHAAKPEEPPDRAPLPPDSSEEATELRLARAHLAELEQAHAAAPIQMADLTARIDALSRRIDQGDAGPPKPVETAESDRLARELDSAQHRLEALRETYPEDWPPVSRAVREVEEIRSRRSRALTRETLAARFAPVRELLEEIRTLSAQRDRLRGEEWARETRIRELRAQVEKLSKERPVPPTAAPARGLRSRPAESTGPLAHRVELAATASPTGFTLPVVLALGLALGAAAAGLREGFATTIRTEHDVRRYVNLPLLGTFPLVRNPEARLLLSGDPHSPLAEPAQTAAALLEAQAREKSEKVFAITSAASGEGKSTVLCNLACALARGGSLVLLIDADLRRPAQHRLFSQTNATGLSSYLTGAVDSIDGAIVPTPIESLQLVPAGPELDQPAPYLRSERFKALIEELRGRFDLILIDLPPTGVAADALHVCPHADGTILVLSSPETRKDDAAQAKRLVRSAKGVLVGCVLNKATIRSRGYYYYSAAPAAAE